MYAYLKKNEKKKKLRLQITISCAAMSAVLCLFVFAGSHMNSGQARASDTYAETTCYTSVYVRAGDSLWSIADTYMDDSYETKASYIDEVKRINHITDEALQAGSYIMVPYTVTE